MKKIVVLHHKDCPDGFGAAWTARRKFGNKADYIGVEHQLPPPSDLKGKDVYFADFCYPAEITGKILKDNKSLAVIDHHATAKNITESVPDHSYSNDHSGAILTWKYFNGSEKAPMLLRYVEDADLWKFKLPHSKDVMAFMETVPYDFKVWDKLVADFENNDRRKVYIRIGELVSNYQEKIIDKVVDDGKKVIFNGYSAMAVNSPILTSEVGHAIVNKGFQIGIIWSGRNGSVRVSLRGNGKVDVSKLAMKYGGGGHKNAAAFRLKTLNKFPWKEKK
jgi:oligoribonuclease NrnB/cAMP/cGMP phosphodiesterase (DHH superfamily)